MGGRIAQRGVGVNRLADRPCAHLIQGLLNRAPEPQALGMLGRSELDFRRPVLEGDEFSPRDVQR